MAVHGHDGAGLMNNAVGLWGDFVAGVATVAPSSSVAFTLALLMSFSGLSSPLAVLIVGVGMLFVAVGYARLNNWKADAGAPYVWVGKVARPWLGFAIGLIAILGSLLANIGNITLAGSYLLDIFSPSASKSGVLVWVVSAAILGIVLYLAIKGIRPSMKFQISLIALEYTIVILFVILALVYEGSGHSGTSTPSLKMLTPALSIGGIKGLVEAAVPCGFLYLGWETTLILGEETKDPNVNPGRAAILGLVFLILWYTFLTIVFQGIASPARMIAHGSDVLSFAGTVLMPQPFARLLPLAVFVAVFGTCQMQLIEASRVVYAMARDKLFPGALAKLSKHRTPLTAGIIIGVIPALALIPYLASTAANTAIGDVISAAGLMYLFMYCVIAFSSAWFYRKLLGRSMKHFFGSGVLPIVGGLMMVFAFVYGLATQSRAIAWVAGIVVALCLVIGIVYSLTSRHPYFHAKPEVFDPGMDGPAEPESGDAAM